MAMVVADLRYAARTLARQPRVPGLATLTLALGIGAATTMFSVVHAILLRPPSFPDPDRLVILFHTSVTPRDGMQRLRWSLPNITELERVATSFDSVGSFTGPLLTISGHGEPEHVSAETVTRGYFQALRMAAIAGRLFTAGETSPIGASPVVLIGERLWKRRLGGDPAAVGATMIVNDEPMTIIGIMPAGFAGLSGKAEIWIAPSMAARLYYAEYLTTPQNFISAIARLKNGVSLEQANAELAAIGPRFTGHGPPDAAWSAVAVPLREARIDPIVGQSALALLAAAACVLLIACVNVAGLLLARSRTRRREIAVRLAIGSSRGRLVRQLFTEGLLIAAGAGICGTLFAWWGVGLFARAAPAVIASGRNNYGAIGALDTPALDPAVLLFAVGSALGTTLLFALVPALTASNVDVMTALKQDDRGGASGGRALSILVVAEVAIACLLVAAAGLLIEGFARIQSRRTGFVPGQVLTFWVRPPGSRYPPATGPATLDRLLARIQAVPGVESAAVNRCVPFTGCSNTILFLADRPVARERAPAIGRHYISADYFQTLGIPILSGRALTAADRAGGPPVAVVNESGARRFWPGENPIGKRVWFGTTTGPFSDPAHAVEIVGVAGDVKYGGVDQSDRPERADFYTSYRQFAFPDTMMIVKTRGRPATLLPAMRTAVASIDPALPIYDAMTLDERISAAVARPRFDATLLGAFAAAALVLAAIGVYGVLSYSVSARMREVGVRLALGADASRVTRLILGEGVRLAMLGAAIGTAASIAVARLVQSALVDMEAWDPRLLAAAGLIMIAVGALAAFVPARRAGAVDPIIVLRND